MTLKIQPLNIVDWQTITAPRIIEANSAPVAQSNTGTVLLVAGIVVISVCTIVIIIENNRLNKEITITRGELNKEREASQVLKRQIASCPNKNQLFNAKNVS